MLETETYPHRIAEGPELVYDVNTETFNFSRRHVAPTKVFNDVCQYFKWHLPEYEVMYVIHASSYPIDDFVYMVEAKRRVPSPYGQGDYACWTSWDQREKTMNFGHYDLPDEEACLRVFSDFYIGDTVEEINKTGAILKTQKGGIGGGYTELF